MPLIYIRSSLHSTSGPTGQQDYITGGTYSWICPAGVTSVCAVCIGSGFVGGAAGPTYDTGGGGGGLGWKNNIAVTPGQSYTVVVGGYIGWTNKSVRQDSYFINVTTVKGGGAWLNSGGDFLGEGGHNGANAYSIRGGGGAGGYDVANNGHGGDGATFNSAGAGGGGVGILGQGSSGANGSGLSGGQGGSGGAPGSNSGSTWGGGGAYGGGGGTKPTNESAMNNGGGQGGAVRLIWGPGRAYPSTLTTNQ